MNADTRAVVAHLWPDQPIPQHLLRDCEVRTPAEAAANVARANRPRNFTLAKVCEYDRREQVAGYSSRRVVSR